MLGSTCAELRCYWCVLCIVLKFPALNPRPCAAFDVYEEGGLVGPLAVWALIELEFRKTQRVSRDEIKPMVSRFMTLGQPLTSEVISTP